VDTQTPSVENGSHMVNYL